MHRIWSCLALLAVVAGPAACAQSISLPDDGFVDVPGGRVAFRILGGGPRIPLLVIHGGPGSSSCIYASSLQPLAAERPVVIYDQLGTGYSDRILDLEAHATVPRFVSEVTAIREELGLSEVHLLGHSWGAVVALEYLLTANPEGVRSVTFVGPLISTEVWLQDADAVQCYRTAATFNPQPGRRNHGVVGSGCEQPEPNPGSPGFRVAWDPVAQRERWRVSLETRTNGGTLTTAGNLVFSGASTGWFYAHDATTGAKLWETQLAPGLATPITYRLDGRQYVTVLAGRGGTGGGGRVWTFILGD